MAFVLRTEFLPEGCAARLVRAFGEILTAGS
jgi:hypothetical protein